MRVLALLVGCLAAFASVAGASVVTPAPNLVVDRSWSDHFEYGQFSESAVTDRASIESNCELDVVITRQNTAVVVIVDRRSSDPPIETWFLAPTKGGEHCGQNVLAIPVAKCILSRPTIQAATGGRHSGLKVLAIP